MSYSSWHDYGYGICVDDLTKEVEMDRLMKLIKMAPNLHKNLQLFMEGNRENFEINTSVILSDFVEDYCECTYGGLASIIGEVIKEIEDIELLVCTDYDGNSYLLYCPTYPWILKEYPKEIDLTEEKLDKIFSKYINIVTDENLKVDYQSVENGG